MIFNRKCAPVLARSLPSPIVRSPTNNTSTDPWFRTLGSAHPYLRPKGITLDTARYFDLRYCTRGSISGQIVIPMYDVHDQLLGYATQRVSSPCVEGGAVGFIMPPRYRHRREILPFPRSLLRYQARGFPTNTNVITIVESFATLWRLWQEGYTSTVCLLNGNPRTLSDAQLAYLVFPTDRNGKVLMLYNNVQSPTWLTNALIARLSRSRWVRSVSMHRVRLNTCTPDELADALSVK